MAHRKEQTAEQLAHMAAKYLAREAGRGTLLTATSARISPDGKFGTVFVSVFPIEDIENALAFLARHEKPFREYLKEEARFARLPFVKFQLDPDDGKSTLERVQEPA